MRSIFTEEKNRWLCYLVLVIWAWMSTSSALTTSTVRNQQDQTLDAGDTKDGKPVSNNPREKTEDCQDSVTIFIPREMEIQLQLLHEVSADKTKKGEIVSFATVDDLIVDSLIVVERGARATGLVVDEYAGSGLLNKQVPRIDLATVESVDGSSLACKGYLELGEKHVRHRFVLAAVATAVTGLIMTFHTYKKGRSDEHSFKKEWALGCGMLMASQLWLLKGTIPSAKKGTIATATVLPNQKVRICRDRIVAPSLEQAVKEEIQQIETVVADAVTTAPGKVLPSTSKVIAVLDLAGYGVPGDTAKGITDMLRTSIAKLKQFRMKEKKEIEELLEKMGFAGPDRGMVCDEVACALSAGKSLEADLVIVGSVSGFAQSFAVTVRLVEVESGEVLWGESTITEAERLPKELDKLASSIAEAVYK